jgi:hypothetical protein
MALNGRKFLAAALLGSSALIAPSMALADMPAPSFITPDRNGVDLTTGLPWVAMEEGGIGSGPGRIAMQRIYAEGAGFQDNWTGGLYSAWVGTQQKMFLQWAGISDTFSGSGTTWTSDKADGGTLTYNSTSGNWIYTSRDGTVFVFPETEGEKTPNCPGAIPKTCRAPSQITRPDGLKFYFSWDTAYICVDRPGEPCWKEYIYHRLLGVSSSAGYGMSIAYESNFPTAGMPSTDPWYKIPQTRSSPRLEATLPIRRRWPTRPRPASPTAATSFRRSTGLRPLMMRAAT